MHIPPGMRVSPHPMSKYKEEIMIALVQTKLDNSCLCRILSFSLQWTNKLILEWSNTLQPFVSIFTNSIIILFINSTNSLHTLKWHIKQGILCYSYYAKGMRSHTIPLQIKTHAQVPKVSQGQLLKSGVNNYERQDLKRLEINHLTFKDWKLISRLS